MTTTTDIPTAPPAQSALPSSPHPPIPSSLSPRDQQLLTTFFNLDLDLIALARHEELSAIELITWAREPAVKAHIEELRAMQRDSLQARHTEARKAAIAALKDVVAASDDPVERRRAASILMRKLDSIPAAAQLPPEPADAQPAAPRTTHDVAEEVFSAILDAESLDEALERIHPHFAPKATFHGQQIPEDVEDFIADYQAGPLADFFAQVPHARGIERRYERDDTHDTYHLYLDNGAKVPPHLFVRIAIQEQGPRIVHVCRVDRYQSNPPPTSSA